MQCNKGKRCSHTVSLFHYTTPSSEALATAGRTRNDKCRCERNWVKL